MRSPFKLKLSQLSISNQSIVTRLLFALFVLYGLFTVGRGLWQNGQLTQEERGLKEEISALTAETAALRAEVAYQQTNSFKEKEARLKLGYKAPGETAVVVPETRVTREDEPAVVLGEDTTDHRSNPEKWWDYFLGR